MQKEYLISEIAKIRQVSVSVVTNDVKQKRLIAVKRIRKIKTPLASKISGFINQKVWCVSESEFNRYLEQRQFKGK